MDEEERSEGEDQAAREAVGKPMRQQWLRLQWWAFAPEQ